jgi:hypothetical protein
VRLDHGIDIGGRWLVTRQQRSSTCQAPRERGLIDDLIADRKLAPNIALNHGELVAPTDA